MVDIVERLRLAAPRVITSTVATLLNEAADTITHLRAEVAEWRDKWIVADEDAKLQREFLAHADKQREAAESQAAEARNKALEEAALDLEQLSADTLRLHMGELSAQEMRAVKAFRDWRASAIRSLKDSARPKPKGETK